MAYGLDCGMWDISIRIRNNVLNQIFKPILPMLAK